jgi:hypothetical protein
MKSHYCPEEKGEVQYDGQCNWCGEKEMNAYQIADDIQDAYCEGEKLTYVANMLRQQADRIAELEKQNEDLKHDIEGYISANTELINEKQSKPVAWVWLEDWLSGNYWPDDCFSKDETTGSVPLYTKPTQPLTTDQIATLFNIHQQDLNFPRLVADVRVVEKAHGIGEEK